MYCMHCGAYNEEASEFCVSCGFQLVVDAGSDDWVPDTQGAPGPMSQVGISEPFASVPQDAAVERAVSIQSRVPHIAAVVLGGILIAVVLTLAALRILGLGPFAAPSEVTVIQLPAVVTEENQDSTGNDETASSGDLEANDSQDVSVTGDDATSELEAGASSQSPAALPVFSQADASSVLAPDSVTSYYGPYNTVDGDMRTAWSEGAAGDGIGEWIELSANSPQTVHGIRIVNGYPKTDEVYTDNNRIRRATITLSDGHSEQVEFADLKGEYQTLTFAEPHETTFVCITINTVYGGTTYSDTTLAEIEVF